MVEGYSYDSLEAIGCIDYFEIPPKTPIVCEAVLAVKLKDIVLVPPFHNHGSNISGDDRLRSRSEFQDLIETYVATAIQPLPASSESCIYVNTDENVGILEYISYTEALKRLISFSSQWRKKGDNEFKQGNLSVAFDAYTMCASASQEAEDYARILLCQSSQADDKLLKEFIIQQGKDPETLVERLRGELNLKEKSSSPKQTD